MNKNIFCTKNVQNLLYALIMIIIVSFSNRGLAEITYTHNHDISKLSKDTVLIDGYTPFLKVSIPNYDVISDPGLPQLPVKYLQFSVPYNASDFTLSISVQQGASIQLYNFSPYPAQDFVPSSFIRESSDSFIPLNTDKFSMGKPFPERPASIVKTGFYDGCNQIVTVALYPMFYYGKGKSLNLISRTIITLNYTLSDVSNTLSTPIISRWQAEESIENVKKMVVNPESVAEFAPQGRQNMPSYSSLDIPIYNYLIVTSTELMDSFDRLVRWKRQKGYNVKVLAIEDIINNPKYAAGDTISNINDDVGKLRACLTDYYTNHMARYVLLAGNHTNMPIRYATATLFGQTIISTDLYFAELNSNWDLNKNGKYGEYTDKINEYIDLSVGRLICKNKQEIDNYISKLILYETNPGKGNKEYLDRSFYFQSDQMQKGNWAQKVASAYKQKIPSNSTFIIGEELSYNMRSPTYPLGKDVINIMNDLFGYVSAHGHGNSIEINTLTDSIDKDPRVSIAAQLSYINPNKPRYTEYSGLDKLTNYDYPFIMHSMSCFSTPFEDCGYEYNMGSAFTVAGKYGGPAYIGNTSYGIIGLSDKFEIEMLKLLCNSQSIGYALCGARTSIIDDPTASHWISLVYNLIGEPEFKMWTYSPSEFSNIAIERTDNSITIIGDTNELYRTTIAVTSNNFVTKKVVNNDSYTFNDEYSNNLQK